MTHTKTQPRDVTVAFNRWMYGLTLVLSLYYLIFSKDIGSALSTLGIGLVFDPFNQATGWKQRPLYQKALLLVHLLFILLLLGILALNTFVN